MRLASARVIATLDNPSSIDPARWLPSRLLAESKGRLRTLGPLQAGRRITVVHVASHVLCQRRRR